jgi:hypothetical protein
LGLPGMRGSTGILVAALCAVAGIALSPALAATTITKKRPAAVKLSFDPISSFTPANGDPRLAKAFANRPLSLSDFTFTPAATKGRPSQLRVAIRARAATPVHAEMASVAAPVATTALTATSYNLGIALGWRRFAVSGDVSKNQAADRALGGRETAVVGVSYSVPRFTGRVAVGADRPEGRPLPALRQGEAYSVDVGGSYSLSRHLDLTGGVRYQVDRQRLSPLQDERRDSQAIYVGTAFKF